MTGHASSVASAGAATAVPAPVRAAPIGERPIGSALVSRARRAADDAAAASGVSLRPVERPADAAEVVRLFCRIWRTSPQDAPVSPDLMLALGHNGGYVAGAYEGEALVGGAVGFLAQDRTLHSHISGVAASARRRSVGHALKLHQRAWALERGIGCITWTFDPLVRRNAWFNLTKLSARGEHYLPDFYGPMRDGINAGEQSDRMLAMWDLTNEQVAASAAGVWLPGDEGALRAGGAVLVLDQDDGQRPMPLRIDAPAGHLLARVPEDIEQLRERDPAAARAWRSALRAALAGRLTSGWKATGFTRSGCYVLRPPP